MPRRPHLLLVLIGLMSFGSLDGQVTTASIYGTVLDSSGAAVPSATITATNTLRFASWSTTSDTAGEFTLTNLTVGTYSIAVQASGFKVARETDLELSAGQPRQLHTGSG